MKPVLCAFLSLVFSACIILSINSKLSASVEPDGSFSYTIPIEVPPGTAGMAPSLSLRYNSNSGNGMLGMGWSLTGLGFITRDYTHPINFNATDHYYGPGGRLVYISTGNFAGDYHYENESFIRIEPFGTQGDGPSYWIETKPDGTKYYYGYTDAECASTNSKVWAPGKTYGGQNCVRVWALSKVEDLHGNYYMISYYQDAGEYYPKTIAYTEHNGFPIADERSVEFKYDGNIESNSPERQDFYATYTYGCSVQTRFRLEEILINLDSAGVREYGMFYEGGTAPENSRLKKVTDSGSEDGVWEFGWEDDNNDGTFTITNPSITSGGTNVSDAWINATGTKIITGDFSGDGKADFILQNTAEGWNSTPIFRSNGNGTFAITNPAISYGGDNVSNAWINAAGTQIITADISGDGKTDFILQNTAEGWNTTPIFLSNGNGTFTITNPAITSGGTNVSDGWINAAGTQIVTGDFNGDGKMDFILQNITASWNSTPIFRSNGNGTFTINNPAFTYGGSNVSDGWINAAGTQIVTGDFNGDGKTDFMLQNITAGWNSTPIFLSNGNGAFTIANPAFTYGGSNVSDIWINAAGTQIITGDFNRDEKMDFMLQNTVVHWNSTPIFLSNGNGTFTIINRAIISGETNASNAWVNATGTQIVTGDLNGDGKMDFMLQNVAVGWNSTPIFSSNGGLQALSSILPPLGSTITIDYTPAAQFADNIPVDDSASGGLDKAIDPATSTYPYITNNYPRNLVASTTTSDGRGKSYNTRYSYRNGKMFMGNMYDRKNLYFECITSQTENGPYTKTYYKQDNQYLAGKIWKAEQYASNAGLMKRQVYDYTAITNAYNTWERLDKITDTTYEGGASYPVFTNIKTFNSYDIYGNPTQITNTASGLETIITTMSYDYSLVNDWVISRPGEVKQALDSGSVLKLEKFVYEGKELRIKQDWLNNSGGSKWISTRFTYDSYGNVATIEAPNASGGTSTTYIYYDGDPSVPSYTKSHLHTFPVRTINYNDGIVFAIDYEFDPVTGQKTSASDYNGQKTEYTYDQFHRLIRVKEPGDDWTKKIFYENWSNPDGRYIEVQTKDNSANGYHWEREYIDGLNRKYKTISEGYNDDGDSYTRVVRYEFDSLGRLYKQYNPYMANPSGSQCDSEIFYTQYYYDAASRVAEKRYGIAVNNSFDSKETTSYPYEGGSRAVVRFTDKNNVVHYSRYDARGRLRERVDDAGGINASVSYTYDALGLLTSTADPGGRITGISYDTFGRKTSMSDPNAGTISYTYYDNGLLHTQTDAKGTILTMTYDELNRLKSELSDEFDPTVNVEYFYDDTSVTNTKGRLTSVEDHSGAGETSFAYDAKGNITAYTKTVDGISFAVGMTYDAQRRTTSITYPDNYPGRSSTVIKRHYADAGYLKAVTDQNDNAYVKYTREAGTGSLCSENKVKRITGNGVETYIQYNPRNLRPVNVMTLKGSSVYENVNYTHDNIGNITLLEDVNTDPNYHTVSETEAFTYDKLNRLLNATATDLYGIKNYSFSANGNLTGKDDKTLVYDDPLHPNAVKRTEASGSTFQSYEYDGNGNMTTRAGKTLVYDAKNRLIEVRDGVIIEEKYTYDYTGFRIKKEIISENTVVYNINGLHELRKTAGSTDQFTNFIYGMNGEIVAQIKGEALGTASLFPITMRMYNWKDFKGFFLKIYAAASAFVEKPENIKMVNLAILVLLLLAAFSILAYNAFFRQRHTLLIPRWLAHVTPGLLFVFMATFGFTGCFDGLFNNASGVTGTFYFHPNHVGSVKMVTDAAGGVVHNYRYDPYGTPVTDSGTEESKSKYRYTAQEADESTGLYYYNARFYDPAIGRFITADSVMPNPANTQAFNRYMYCSGNPVKYNDPTGHDTGSGDGALPGPLGAAYGAGYAGYAGCADASAVAYASATMAAAMPDASPTSTWGNFVNTIYNKAANIVNTISKGLGFLFSPGGTVLLIGIMLEPIVVKGKRASSPAQPPASPNGSSPQIPPDIQKQIDKYQKIYDIVKYKYVDKTTIKTPIMDITINNEAELNVLGNSKSNKGISIDQKGNTNIFAFEEAYIFRAELSEDGAIGGSQIGDVYTYVGNSQDGVLAGFSHSTGVNTATNTSVAVSMNAQQAITAIAVALTLGFTGPAFAY